MKMGAGGVTSHDGCNFHNAGPNRTDRPRRAFAIIYIPDHITFNGGKGAAGATEEMTAGGPWDHPLHPVLAAKQAGLTLPLRAGRRRSVASRWHGARLPATP